MTATAKKASQEISSNATPDPRLPWPIPAEGFKLEVARFYYNPTERANGGEWCYTVKVRHDADGIRPTTKVFSLSAWREREDYITKKRHDLQIVLMGSYVEVSTNAKRLPAELAKAVADFVAATREKAEKDEARYSRAIEVYEARC